MHKKAEKFLLLLFGEIQIL